ncbi:MAG: ABC transporter ATP-binding protein, partial [Myxococcales bacterium]|nr:ABC transporter ATP-binding protein [Myxococcales bacterium]
MSSPDSQAPPETVEEEGKGTSLWAYLRPYRGQVTVGIALLLVTNALDKSIPWLLRGAVDAIAEDRPGEVPRLALTVVAIAAVMWAVRSWSRVKIFNVGRDVEYDLRNELVDRIHLLGAAFFSRMATGQIMSRATNDLGQVRLLIGFGLLNVTNALFAYVGALALMITISPKLTLFAILPYPVLVVVMRLFNKSFFNYSRDAQQALARLADRTQEHLMGIRVVRSLGLERFEEERFEEVNQEALRANMKLVVIRGVMWPLLTGISSVGTLIGIGVGGSMVIDGELTIGEFAAFNAYLGQLLWPTMAAGFLFAIVQRGKASYRRVREILDAEPEICSEPGAPIPSGPGALSVRGLSFSYDDRSVLDDVSFEVPAGGSLAILGPTGSGKSTLAALLPRLLPTPKGAVLVDGQDVTEVDVRGLRKHVGYAQQDPFLFSTTVTRNIGFALEEPDAPGAMERILHATEEAVVADDIAALPDKEKTLVGERGVQLSGGQKQRIALARALLNEPTTLILDDPLSAVDARTESL